MNAVATQEELTLTSWTKALTDATHGETLADVMDAWLQARSRVPRDSMMYHLLTASLLYVTMVGVEKFGASPQEIEALKEQMISAWKLAQQS